MNLTKEQLAFYAENGYLVLKKLLSRKEVKLLTSRIVEFDKMKNLPNVICENDGSIRSIFTPNLYEPLFDELYRSERIVGPSRRLVGEDIYLYQYKLNLKRPFKGKAWEWHQDYAYWKLDDGIERPDMISAMIYLSDVKAYQGPLMIIPGSHKDDVVTFQDKAHLQGSVDLINALGADLKYTVHQKHITDMATKKGIKTLEFDAGTCIFFHPNLFHASTGNLSPFQRDTAIITYNSVTNLPTKTDRPTYVCADDYTPVRTYVGALSTL